MLGVKRQEYKMNLLLTNFFFFFERHKVPSQIQMWQCFSSFRNNPDPNISSLVIMCKLTIALCKEDVCQRRKTNSRDKVSDLQTLCRNNTQTTSSSFVIYSIQHNHRTQTKCRIQSTILNQLNFVLLFQIVLTHTKSSSVAKGPSVLGWTPAVCPERHYENRVTQVDPLRG